MTLAENRELEIGTEIRPLRIGPLSIWPPVTLAPMAGETGSVLRILSKRLGAGLVHTELTSSHLPAPGA